MHECKPLATGLPSIASTAGTYTPVANVGASLAGAYTRSDFSST